ncbi:MAG TPA: hypothetical protein EYP55_03260 [Anaerolineae bacterium]|nr:hypothetical protein [Anaerolineae bacterium]
MHETRFVRVPTAVEARFDEEGRLTPTSFTWQGRVQSIADVGRRWVEEEEGRPIHHILVMTSSQELFELCFDPRDLRWQVRRTWERRVTA